MGTTPGLRILAINDQDNQLNDQDHQLATCYGGAACAHEDSSPMTLRERVQEDVRAAMKDGARERVGALRLVLSELQKAAKDGQGDELAVLRRERKRRLEAASAYADAGRGDLAEQERAEAEMIATYLPAELDAQQLREIVQQAVADSGAQTQKDMGIAMKSAIAAVDGRAEGKRVSELVRETLSA